MKKTIKKQIRKPFTMEAFESENLQFIMRDGTPVDNLQYISEISIYPVISEIDGHYYSWTTEGHYISEIDQAPEDLFELVEIEVEVEVEVDSIKRIEFTEEEIVYLMFILQSGQDSFGDKKFFPEDSELKKSHNEQLQSWIEKSEALYKKILTQHWIELPTPPQEEIYGSLTDEYLEDLTNQNK